MECSPHSYKIIQQLMDDINSQVKTINIVKGGLTNETYLVFDGKTKYIARIAGKGTEKIINRANELCNMKIAEELGISPKVYSYREGSFLMEYIDSPTIQNENELRKEGALEKVINVLYKLNTSGKVFGDEYNLLQNINIYKRQLKEMKVQYPEEVLKYEQEFYELTVGITKEYEFCRVACHIDNIFGNIIMLSDTAMLIDWEYSGMSDIYNELANFALLNDLSSEMERIFLKKYFNKAEIKCDYAKYWLYKMANNYMWVYWHLIKYNQFQNIQYNNRRWKERLYLALECKKKYEEIRRLNK